MNTSAGYAEAPSAIGLYEVALYVPAASGHHCDERAAKRPPSKRSLAKVIVWDPGKMRLLEEEQEEEEASTRWGDHLFRRFCIKCFLRVPQAVGL